MRSTHCPNCFKLATKHDIHHKKHTFSPSDPNILSRFDHSVFSFPGDTDIHYRSTTLQCPELSAAALVDSQGQGGPYYRRNLQDMQMSVHGRSRYRQTTDRVGHVIATTLFLPTTHSQPLPHRSRHPMDRVGAGRGQIQPFQESVFH